MRTLVIGLAALAAAPAAAEDGPGGGGQVSDDDLRFCPSRPSLVDTPCTVQPGHVLLEASALDWTLDDRPDAREDVVLSGDAALRIGVAAHADLQVNWTAFGHDRVRSKMGGGVAEEGGVGDVRVAVRRNLLHPDGRGFSIAVEPYVTAPTGGAAIGAGDWGYGLVLPVNYDLSDTISLQFTGSTDAAVDQDRSGRHFSYSGDWGLGWQFARDLTLVGEVQVTADRDPAGHMTQSVAAGSLAWQPTKRTQLDLLVGAGLNRDTPDLRLVTGGAVEF